MSLQSDRIGRKMSIELTKVSRIWPAHGSAQLTVPKVNRERQNPPFWLFEAETNFLHLQCDRIWRKSAFLAKKIGFLAKKWRSILCLEIICYWANFHGRKWPHVEKFIMPSGHTVDLTTICLSTIFPRTFPNLSSQKCSKQKWNSLACSRVKSQKWVLTRNCLFSLLAVVVLGKWPAYVMYKHTDRCIQMPTYLPTYLPTYIPIVIMCWINVQIELSSYSAYPQLTCSCAYAG